MARYVGLEARAPPLPTTMAGPSRAKQVLPPSPPADETRDLPLAYTTFHAPPFVNAKSV